MTRDELPCPFCRGASFVEENGPRTLYIACLACDASVIGTPAQAKALWAAPPPDTQIEAGSEKP